MGVCAATLSTYSPLKYFVYSTFPFSSKKYKNHFLVFPAICDGEKNQSHIHSATIKLGTDRSIIIVTVTITITTVAAVDGGNGRTQGRKGEDNVKSGNYKNGDGKTKNLYFSCNYM